MTRPTLRLLAAAVLLSTPRARAADVVVQGRGITIDFVQLRTLVALELGARDEAETAGVRVTVDGAHARVLLVFPGAAPLVGDIDLRDSPDPERAIALLVGTLATTSSSRFEPAGAPSLPDAHAPEAKIPPSTPAPRDPRSSRPDSRKTHFAYTLGSADARLLLRGGALTAAPRLEGGFASPRWGRIGLVIRYTHARADDALGTISAHAVTGGPSATFRLVEVGALALAAGPRAEAGVAFASGHGVLGRTTSGDLWLGAAALEAAITIAPVRLVVGLEAGWAARGLSLLAEDRRILELSGPFVGAGLGLALDVMGGRRKRGPDAAFGASFANES